MIVFEGIWMQEEIIITFFENNRAIAFKASDCEKASVSDGFLVIETEGRAYFYNCSAIKSIEIA